jgi:hypothetical protein
VFAPEEALEKIERPSKKRSPDDAFSGKKDRTLMRKLQTEEGKSQSGP